MWRPLLPKLDSLTNSLGTNVEERGNYWLVCSGPGYSPPPLQTDFWVVCLFRAIVRIEDNRKKFSIRSKSVVIFYQRGLAGYNWIRKGQQLTKNGQKYVCFCCNQISPILLTPRTCLFCYKVHCSEQKADQTTEPC